MLRIEAVGFGMHPDRQTLAASGLAVLKHDFRSGALEIIRAVVQRPRPPLGFDGCVK
jgi:hypothetical protein